MALELTLISGNSKKLTIYHFSNFNKQLKVSYEEIYFNVGTV